MDGGISPSDTAPVNPAQSQSRYRCFCIPSTAPSWWRSIRTRGSDAVFKIREWSELVAGPRWKTFIRRFNRTKRSGSIGRNNLQYDPLSYAMNFDEGHGQNGNFDQDEEDGYFTRNFSSRYAKGYLDGSAGKGGGGGMGSTSV